MEARRFRKGAFTAARACSAGGLGLLLAVAVAACSGGGGGGEDDQGAAPTPTVSAPATPVLNAAEARRLAEDALLSPDSPLLDGYEAERDAVSANRPEFAPLYDCTREETVDGRLAAFSQTFEGPRPRIRISAHAYDDSAVDVLAQLRETWDSECTTFEEADAPDPYRSERIETVPAPDGVDPDHWAADCAELTLLEDDQGGIVNCSAFVAIGEHVILAIELQGLIDERDSYADLLGAIASEVIEAQE